MKTPDDLDAARKLVAERAGDTLAAEDTPGSEQTQRRHP